MKKMIFLKKYNMLWQKQPKTLLAAAALAMFGIFFAYLSAAAWGSMGWAKDKVMFYLQSPISVESAQIGRAHV